MERLVWLGPVRHIGGYGEVARGFLRGLQALAADLVAVDTHGPAGDPGALALEPLEPLLAGPVQARGRTCVYHAAPDQLPKLLAQHPMPGAERRVACTIAETDRLPEAWVAALEPFDEVWVPACFQRESFAFSGVPRAKLRVVPYGIDTHTFAPPEPAPGPRDRFGFLYSFQLDWRKGFDVLLEAYCGGFRRADPVELLLKLFPGAPGGPSRADLVASVAEHIDFFDPELPRVRVIEGELSRAELTALYHAAGLYVSTDRANGWGMPCLEAQACGTPVATVDWSGSTEFLHEGNALLIPPGPLEPVDARLAAARPAYAGQHWPALAVADVRAALREALERPEALRERAARGLDEVRRERSLEAAARGLLERESRPYRPRAGLLAKVLRGLERPDPDALLAGARARVLLCSFAPGDSRWRAPLRRYLARQQPDDDVSLCLWLDAAAELPIDALIAEIEAELETAGPPETRADVMLSVAPLDHVPWDRIEIDPELTPA